MDVILKVFSLAFKIYHEICNYSKIFFFLQISRLKILIFIVSYEITVIIQRDAKLLYKSNAKLLYKSKLFIIFIIIS